MDSLKPAANGCCLFVTVAELHAIVDSVWMNVYNSTHIMPTNLAIDDRLIAEAQKLGRHRTKKDTVNAALAEYIRRRKQQKILSAFGTVEYQDGYDYKRERAKRS